MQGRIKVAVLAGALAVSAGACSDSLGIPNYNNPTVDGIGKDPNGVQLLATGILYNQRNQLAGFARDVMIFGREGYNYFQTDGRNVSNYLVGIPGPQRLDPSGFASGNWNGRYQDIKNAVALTEAGKQSSTFTDAQKSAVEGFADTWYALDMLYVIMTRDSLGAPVETSDDATAPKPFVSRDSVYKFITAKLDAGYAKLQAGGAAFPFTLHSGFAGFDTPANFAKFNRAIQARNLVIRGTLGCGATCYQQALTALTNSFVTPIGGATTLAQLNVGPYHLYSSAAGDVLNANSFATNNYIFAHASFGKEAQLQSPGGPRDDRYLRKIDSLAAPVSPPGNQNIPAYHKFNVYPTNSTPAPVIRNEELILLRAEANIGTGNLAAALQDINNIRTVSGKLAPLASLGANPIDALMYERRYSLILEGMRWVDMRRWGRLNQLPLDQPGFFVAKVMPIPQTECDGRVEKPNGCA
jgi:hypothetical protein